MYKRALVLTDNIVQYERFRELINNPIYKDVQFTFKHSPTSLDFSLHKDFVGQNHSLKVKCNIPYITSNFDILFSIHCKQIFPPALVRSIKCINIHPGYNPINRGWYPQVFAIINNRITGATLHEIDEELDNGPIIDRIVIEHYVWETSKDIYERILKAEIYLLEKNLANILSGTYNTILPENKGFLYLKKDFKDLCHLNLEEVNTFNYFINKLRALTHGQFKNAYFIDAKTGKKIFISINLEVEGNKNVLQ